MKDLEAELRQREGAQALKQAKDCAQIAALHLSRALAFLPNDARLRTGRMDLSNARALTDLFLKAQPFQEEESK